MLLLAPWEVLAPRAKSIIEEGKKLPGHIFNLGHGIVPDVDPSVVTRLVEYVHEQSER
jgi:uroporphyrinogen decarboxylase